MKFFSLLLLAAPLVSALAQRDAALTVNPPADNLVPVTHENVVAAFPQLATTVQSRDTNAHRLARGLPPNPPRSIRNTLKNRTPTRVQHAARAGPSPMPTGGAIRVTDNSGNQLGFLSVNLNTFGEYGLTSDADDVVGISALLPADGSAFDLTATNPPVASLPLIGTTTGYANDGNPNDLTAGSYNYAYLTAQSTSTGAGSSAQNTPNSFTTATDIPENSESTIWTYNAATGEIFPQWTNSDGTQPPVTLIYDSADATFAITGDVAQFDSTFGDATVVHFYLSNPPSKR